jgi:hypothetical protein
LCSGTDLLRSGSILLCASTGSILRMRSSGTVLRMWGSSFCPVDDDGPAASWCDHGSSAGTGHGSSRCSAAAAGRTGQAWQAEGLIPRIPIAAVDARQCFDCNPLLAKKRVRPQPSVRTRFFAQLIERVSPKPNASLKSTALEPVSSDWTAEPVAKYRTTAEKRQERRRWGSSPPNRQLDRESG